MWTPYGVLLGDPVFQGGVHVVQMEQLESNWTPHGLHMDSGQKIGWATTQKKMSKVHMDSTWNLWGRVKSSFMSLFNTLQYKLCKCMSNCQIYEEFREVK